MKKILVPTDFSKPAQIATEVEIDIAKKAKSELILLHVIGKPIDIMETEVIPEYF